MKAILTEIVEHLKNGDYKNEEHVRVAIVLRILQALGWDIWNPRECYPEFPPNPKEEKRWVDVALFKPTTPDVPAVFIEVKMVGKLVQTKLDDAENQLEEYNRRNQAEITVLTDGQFWRFYLSSAPGKFRQRCFIESDISKAAIDEIEQIFRTFLSRDRLISNNAKKEAERLLERSNEEKIMDKAYSQALNDVVRGIPSFDLVVCLRNRCAEYNVDIDEKRVKEFLLKKNSHTGNPLPPPLIVSAGKRMRLSLTYSGINAIGVIGSDGKKITVSAGALAGTATDNFMKKGKGYAELRKKLEAEGILIPTELSKGRSGFKLTRDYEFDSLAVAGSVLAGFFIWAQKDWKEVQ
ncbi:MAG: hypothetical protein LBG78_03130 [Azoarcus sp.]|jgi:predicted type IV restriction endonuclease|nr:hypothetical protein [Azoarcus sp.]